MRPLTVFGLGALAFLGAFYATKIVRPPPEVQSAGAAREQRGVGTGGSQQPGAPSTSIEAGATASGVFSNERLDALLKEPGYLVRRVQMRALFDALPPGAYAEVCAAITGNPQVTEECLAFFFSSWFHREPEAAMLRAYQTLAREHLTVFRQLLGYWGEHDEEAARKFARNLAEDERTPFLNWLDQRSAALKQPETPRRKLRDDFMRNIRVERNGMSLGMDYEHVTLPALRRWVQADPAAAAAEILRSPAMRDTRDFVRIVFEEWKKTDASAAEAFFASLTKKEQRDLITPMAVELAEKDPAAARLLAERLPATGNWREWVLTEVGKKVAEKDPAAIPTWIESIRHGNSDFLPMSLFAVWFKHDPKAAAKALLEFPAYQDHLHSGKDERLVTSYIDLSAWVAAEPGPASDFMATLPIKDLKDTLEKIGKKWVQADAVKALDWARSRPAGPLQDEALRQFTYVWARAENREVIAHLQSLPRGSGKSAAIEGFAFASFDTDPDQVLQWTRQIHDPGMRVDVLSRAWSDWRRKNRSGAEDWVDNVAALEPVERKALEKVR
jgi:hypothetical protein